MCDNRDPEMRFHYKKSSYLDRFKEVREVNSQNTTMNQPCNDYNQPPSRQNLQ